MSNLKQKVSYRVMALFMAVLMLVSMIPATVIAYALDSAESSYKATNFTATYNSENDAVDLSWDAFETEPYELWVCVDDVKTEKLDNSDTTYSVPTSVGGEQKFSLLAFVDEEDTEGVKSAEVAVEIANTFASVIAFDSEEVDNDLTITEIVAMLTTDAKVAVDENGTESVGHTVRWNTESVNYDQTASEEQTITIPGVVVLDKNVVQNRNNLSLDCSIEVKVKAAVDVAISSDLDDSAPIEKKVGESVALSVEATGTAPEYQWYKKTAEETEGTIIDGATSATFTISSLALTDSSQYYCVITGKNNSTVTSKIATVNVSKNATAIDLSINPSEGQTRPQSITLEAVGVPDDATGKVIFKEGDNLIKEIALPNADKTAIFTAYGANNDYDFTVIYDAGDDNIKYLGSEKTINGYGFNKADQAVNFKSDTVPSKVTYSENTSFTVQAEGSQTNLAIKYEYAIVEEKDADDEPVNDFVASVDKKTGKVTILAAGTFKVSVKALSDDDYNESPVVISDKITVNRAEQGEFKFETGDETTTYTHNFTYKRNLAATGTGNGTITYKLGDDTTAVGVVVNSETGEITFADATNDNSANFTGKVGRVEVIATKAKDKWVNEKSTSYIITIEKAEQSIFKFATEAPSAITYTANEGTTYTNIISSEDDKNGWVNVNNVPVYSIVAESALPGDSVTTASNVVSIDSTSGTITAKRSGVVTIKATLAGNGVYNAVETTYTITVNRGTVETAANGDNETTGFKFNLADSEIKYGFDSFFNVAAGGQEDSTTEVIYSDDSDELNVSENDGVITFVNAPADAATDTYVATITATKPETEKYLACSITYDLTVTRDAVDSATDFKVNDEVIKDATLLTSHNGWYNAAHTNITITPSAPYTQISENGIDWKDSIVRTKDDKHAIAFYLKDEKGNTSLISNQSVNYDTKTATVNKKMGENQSFWSKLLETITFGLWHNTDVDLTVTVNDELSGIYSISYYEDINPSVSYKNAEEIERANLTWKECQVTDSEKGSNTLTKTINVSVDDGKNKKSVVYVKVVDCAGNIEYFVSSGMILDKVDPKQDTELPDPIIEIKLDDNKNEGLYNAEVPFTLTVNDEQTDAVASGIKNIKVTIKGSDNENYEKVINIASTKSEISSFDSADINSDEFTVDNTFVVPAEFDSNYLTILVEVEDYAGNTYTNKDAITNLAIDKTIPVIEVTYNDTESTFSNEKYIGNNKNRVATIDITELNFDPSAVVITMSNDGKTLDIKPYFTAIEGSVDENGDQIGWRMTIDYATLGEGEFDFDIAYTDKATNANDGWIGDDIAVNKNFIIDNTKPIISVEITNADVKNDKYFAADRTATVTIIERNFSEDYKFDWSGLTFELDDAPLAAPTPVIIKNNNDTYERVYTIDFSAEGDYTFDVKYTDLADNLADTYSCSSVSYKEFTVDKTAPVLDITGVADKSANNGAVAPVITYSDINFNRDAVSIVLSGINNGTVNYNGGISAEDAHGQTYTYANFEKEQYVDDIYTLTAKLTDMAGNETEKVISFSVNRFGSVYDISNVKDIISSYLQNEQDIVFTETNVDSLEREGIIVKLTKNGTPITLTEGIDYTVSVTGGNGQWSVYTYTVNKALFADDGTYSISVYSVDAAGNVNENIDETKEAEISFGIDKTKPVVVPIDLESGKQYPVEGKEVSIEIKDNLVLEDVKIYLNGKEIEYTVEGEAYTFFIPESNNVQDVKVVATDAAGNEYELVVEDFLVSTNIFVRWFNNTPLFIGSIAGVVAIVLGVTAFILFGKKKKEDKDDAK